MNKSIPLLPKLIFLLVVILTLASCQSGESTDPVLTSPNGRISVHFLEEAEGVSYLIQVNGDTILLPSRLGLLTGQGDFYNQLSVSEYADIEQINESYSLAHGKRLQNEYIANRQVLHVVNNSNNFMDIVFQVSDDGVVFRYEFPDSTGQEMTVREEMTRFAFPEGTRTWIQPMAVAKTGWEHSNPSYEENYELDIASGTSSPTDAGWVYPALFRTGNSWVLITESGLDNNYCGTRLAQDSPGGVYQVAFPPEEEKIFDGPVKPVFNTPWASPWRVLAIGSLKNIIESNLGNAVAEPAIDLSSSFIQPGIASWSWAILKDESITYPIQKEFIDFASRMNWNYCLIDVNWDTTIGYDKIAELSSYAASKGVGLILWYNSAGDWNTTPYHPRDKLLERESRRAEFERIHQMGIKGIKVDFFGGDGQSVIKYYHDIMQDAADFELLVNFHGATLPRGWHRTYPNLMTMESIKGFEFITFDQRNADRAAALSALVPFTRNAFDPMDFTPMNLTEIPGIDRRTSPAFELALPTLFLSGIQHLAETPAGMDKVPDYVQEYLKDIPVAWDETRFIDGFPGEYIVVARRKGETWFLSGINALDEEVTIETDLSFTEDKPGIMIGDGDDRGFVFRRLSSSDSVNTLILQPKGGMVMKF